MAIFMSKVKLAFIKEKQQLVSNLHVLLAFNTPSTELKQKLSINVD